MAFSNKNAYYATRFSLEAFDDRLHDRLHDLHNSKTIKILYDFISVYKTINLAFISAIKLNYNFNG